MNNARWVEKFYHDFTVNKCKSLGCTISRWKKLIASKEVRSNKTPEEIYSSEAGARFTWGVRVFVIGCPQRASANPAAVLWSTKCVKLFPFQTNPPATFPLNSYSTHPEILGPKPETQGLHPRQGVTERESNIFRFTCQYLWRRSSWMWSNDECSFKGNKMNRQGLDALIG